MRLRDIYVICRKAHIDLNAQYHKILDICSEKGKKGKMYRRSEKKLLYKEFIAIAKIDIGGIEYFRKMINAISGVILSNESDRLKLIFIEVFLDRIQGVIDLYEAMGLPAKEKMVLNIKIPETNNITIFKEYVDYLEFVCTKCPFFYTDEARLEFDSVDVGSVWLVMGVVSVSIAAGSMLLNNIAAFVDICLYIIGHIEKLKMQKEKEKLLKNLNELYDSMVKNAIKKLEEKTGRHIKDKDEMERVEQSIERTIKVLDKGLQMYAAIDSPPEVKAEFAPLKMHYLSIGKKLKRLEEKDEEEN